MTVAEYIVRFLKDKGVDKIFMVTGGQAMFLNDAVFKVPGVKGVFNHHEQASGMAAEAYGRVSGTIGVAMVTAGPGAINVLNGVLGAYVDSAPMMVLSGQSAYPTVSYMQRTKIRQHGLQGINIEPIARPITKYFKTIDDPAKIRFYMEEAYYFATSGRTGPVWIEIPLDIQRMGVPARSLKKFVPPRQKILKSRIGREVEKTLKLLYASKRPLILAGQGIKLANALVEFRKFLQGFKIPTLTTRLGIDLIDSDNPLFVGRPGLYPDRASNIAIQNTDLIISIGARLDLGLIGYEPHDWGRNAKKVVVEIDNEELNKPTINIDLAINGDAGEFLREMNKQLSFEKLPKFIDWVDICSGWRNKYPMVLPKYKTEKLVNSYYFSEVLSTVANKKDVIVVDTSSPFHVVCQTWKVKLGQRFITTGGISTMGYWPASIGACLASGGNRTIVVAGDGCLQMNIQELATVSANKLPIKLFVINNGGYLLIRHTQKTHMEGRLLGESPRTGLFMPDFKKIADAYSIPYLSINNSYEVENKTKQALSLTGPVLIDVKSPHWQLIIPRISSSRQPDGSMKSRPYEDLFPFLPPEELKANMIVDR